MIASSWAVGRSGSRSGANETIVSSTPRSLRDHVERPNRFVSGSQRTPRSASWIRCADSRCGAGSSPTTSAIYGQRVGRPEVDRVEQRPGDQERHLVQQLGVVVARSRDSGRPGTRTGRTPRWSGGRPGFAWSRSWRTYSGTAPSGMTISARSRSHAGELSSPDSHGCMNTGSADPTGPPLALEVIVLGDESRVDPAEERGRGVDVTAHAGASRARPGRGGAAG